jgi:hypothetical protein
MRVVVLLLGVLATLNSYYLVFASMPSLYIWYMVYSKAFMIA